MKFESFAEAYKIVNDFVKLYNTKRIHSSTKYMPPAEFFEHLRITGEKVNLRL